MCNSVAFSTLEECMSSIEVKEGNVRVYKEGTKPPGTFVPPPGDTARAMHLEQVVQHFERNKATTRS